MTEVSLRSDAERWRAAKDGELGAFGTLYRRHAPLLHEQVIAMCGPGAPAADIVTAAFLRVWRRDDGLSLGNGDLWPSLTLAAAQIIYGDRRSTTRAMPLTCTFTQADSERGRPSTTQPDVVLSSAPTGENDALSADLGHEAVLLFLGAGLSLTSVADALQTTRDAVLASLGRYAAHDRS
jgi:DNA-directed RNA polymerase specialized sigma24 family protein